MNKNILAGIGITLSLFLGIFAVSKPAQVEKQVGAVAGPDILSPYFSYGGLRHWAAIQPMRSATTSVCAIQSPAATSTLTSATVNFQSSASYATAYELAEDPTAYASTTALVLTYAVPANATPVFVATTTVTALAPDGIMPPNTWVNLRLSTTSTSATFAPVGNCAVTFREVQ